MDTINITLSREELTLIKDALNTQAVHYSGLSKTIGVDCMHPDFWHRRWDEITTLLCKVIRALHPENEQED